MANFLAPLRQSFVNGPGGMRLTEDQIRARDLIARSLLQNATDTSPTAGGWASILAKGAAGLASNYQQTKADNAVNANAKAASDADSAFYSSLSGQLGGAPAATTSALPAPGASGEMAAISPSAAPPPEIQSLIAEVVPPDLQSYATNLVGKESSFNPNAVSPTGATGLAQFTKGTGKQYGLINDAGDFRSDPRANLNALVRLTTDNKAGLAAALGRAPTDGELALAHQQGLQGAISLLSGKPVSAQNLAVNNIDPNTDPRAAAQKIMAFYGGSGGQPATAAIQAQSPTGSYVDPQVASYAGQDPATIAASLPTTPTAISPVAQALVAQPQDTSASALPLTDTIKGGRLGQPSITQQNFNDRMGGQPSPAFDPSTVQDYGTQAPQQAQPQAAPSAAAPQSAAPTFTLPAPRLPPAPQPLNPAIIKALQSPDASPQTKQVAAALLNQSLAQKQAYQEQVVKAQQQQQTLQQRAALAQSLGLSPNVALDEDLWKEAAKSVYAAPSTSTVGNDVVDNRTHQVIYSGKPAPTTEIQQFEYNQKNPAFGPYEQSMKRAGAQNINTGTIPPGYEQFTDPITGAISMRVIPGGPKDDSLKTAAQAESKANSTDVITNAANLARQALKAPGLPATGSVGKAMAGIPESNAAELRRQVGVLKSNSTIEALNAMRQESPTGGALGNVTEGEGAMLAAKAGVIDPDSPYFERDVNDYERSLLRVVHGNKAGDLIFDQTRKQDATKSGDIPPAPKDVEPDVWKYMTPEQRALWQ